MFEKIKAFFGFGKKVETPVAPVVTLEDVVDKPIVEEVAAPPAPPVVPQKKPRQRKPRAKPDDKKPIEKKPAGDKKPPKPRAKPAKKK